MGDVRPDSSTTSLVRSPALSVTDFSALVSSAFQLNQDRLHLADSLALEPSFDFGTHSFEPKKHPQVTGKNPRFVFNFSQFFFSHDFVS